MTLNELIHACQSDWDEYTKHSFVETLADGSLDPKAYLHYLKQDYLFLKQYSRAYALAIYKSDRLDEMRAALPSLALLLDHEMEHHVQICEGHGIARDALEDEPEDFGTVAYTRYVLDTGMAGDVIDLYTALAPCAIGYAQIGKRLGHMSAEQLQQTPYASWIEMYSSAEFQDGSEKTAAALNQQLAEIDLNSRRGQRLCHIFKTATRMEVAFWQQGLDAVN
ncbi:MAG: TenA family protein [Vibrio sp.]